ncbi:MAG TPA: PAS domain-containing protein [Sphingobacteriaceae bacterium]
MSLPLNTETNTYAFMQGGGELGELTRAFNWEETSLGPPDQWPQSLCTTLGIVLHSKFPMFLLWGDEFICFYNDAYRPSLGINGKHPAVGKKGREVWAEIWDFAGVLWERVKETAEPVWFEDQLVPIYRNGRMEDVYWTFSYSPVYGNEGQVDGVLVTCTETTEKVLNVNRLIDSERRLQNFIREANVAIAIVIGEEMIIQVANQAYGTLIGRDSLDLIGKQLFDVVPEAEADFRHIMDQVRITGEPLYLYDHPYFLFVDGKKKEGFLNIVYQPYKEEDGKISGLMAFCHDVTDQVINRKQLELSEQRVRSIVESAPFPIGVYTGKEMRIELANQSILDVWGKGNDVVGKLYSDVLPELANQKIYEQLDGVYTTGTPFHARNQRVDLVIDGVLKPHYFNYSFTPLYDSSGDIYGVMNTAAEVTETIVALQKIEKNEQELLEIKRQLETELAAGKQLQQQKDDFIGIASHELKTPLASLKGSMQLLSRRAKEVEGLAMVDNLIKLANNSITKLSHILEELLNDTKINEGQLQLNKSHFKLDELIDDCSKMVEIIGTHQITTHGVTDLEVYADKQRIEQVLINLVNNAMKYAPNSKEIRIDVYRNDYETRISVSDQGPGIPAEKLPHLFKRYYRVDTGGIQFSGLGLGLFIVSEIISRHNGKLGVESELQQGSKFWFTIPHADF